LYPQVPLEAGLQGVAAPAGQLQTSLDPAGQSASLVQATTGVGVIVVSKAAPVVGSKLGSHAVL
jgi:hypothetical protein